MILRFFAVFTFILLFSAIAANRDGCNDLNDRDQRLFCLAQVNNDPVLCEQIKSDNWRNVCQFPTTSDPYDCEEFKGKSESFLYYCYALTYDSVLSCFQIYDPDMENLCYGHVTGNAKHCKYVDDPSLNMLCNFLSK